MGYTEEGQNKTKYAKELDCLPGFYNGIKNGFPWCDVFVDWCFYKAYGEALAKYMINHNVCGAGCEYSAKSYNDMGRLFRSSPKEGDQIFFKNEKGVINHTGIVCDVSGGNVFTVEGNVGNGVAKRIYNLTDARIFGYGRSRDLDTWENEDREEDDGTERGGRIIPPENPLSYGDDGVFVAIMQYMLSGLYYDIGYCGVDGEFGRDTLGAVKSFQRDNNIEVTGNCCKTTWKELMRNYE